MKYFLTKNATMPYAKCRFDVVSTDTGFTVGVFKTDDEEKIAGITKEIEAGAPVKEITEDEYEARLAKKKQPKPVMRHVNATIGILGEVAKPAAQAPVTSSDEPTLYDKVSMIGRAERKGRGRKSE